MNLQKATSRAWLEVDEDSLIFNYRLARSLCAPQTELIAVVKANAYGMGLERTAQTLHSAGVNWFSVAAPEEALSLRAAVPGAEILFMGIADESYLPDLIRKNISLTVGTLQDGERASKIATALNQSARVHIKLDTGLHRLGFGDGKEALKLKDLPGLAFEGLYSHLALRSREQSQEQYRLFMAMAEEIRRGGIAPSMLHLLDSIGLTRYPQWQLNAVRLGAFLYGNVPVSWERFEEGKNVAAFKARVTRVDWVKKGEGVGYDDAPLDRDTRVATLSAGYIDGYPRALSQKGFVSLHGKRARVLGLICMDQMMVDVTDIPEAIQGDEVTLLGGSIDLREYAAWGDLNRNECLGIIGRRVPRVYIRNGVPVHIQAEMDGEKE